MKKFILYVSMCLMVCLAAIGLSACGGPRLRTPLNLEVNIVQQEISWAPVEGVIRYRYEINGEESTTRTTKVSIENLAEGNYTVRVRAESDGRKNRDSQWTEKVSFTKEKEDGLAHRLINGNTAFEVTGLGKVTAANIVIDSTFRGLPVTRIADSAFANTGRINTVEIPESVKEIGARAFYNCAALGNIVIPESVNSIGNYAFQRCRALTSVTLPSTLSAINDYTFSNCSSLTTVNLGNSLTTIGKYAFADCQELTSVRIPDSVESIGEFAFYHCISAGDVTVGNGCKTIGASAFGGCTALTKLTLGSGLETIGERAFADCSSLTDLDLGTGVQTIGAGAFMNNTALTTLTVPDCVTMISEAAFGNCSSLDNITIGTGLEYMSVNAFYQTKRFSDQMNAGEGLIYIDTWLVGNANMEQTTVTLNEDTVGVAEYALYGSNALQGILFPESVKYINNYACFQLGALASANFGNGVIRVGDYAFANCTVLTTINFGTGLESIGQYAFTNGLLLQTVNISSSLNLRTIDRYAFSGCKTLASINLPEGLESIGVSAFRNCEKLGKVYLPSTLKAIETQAFTGSGFYNSLDSEGSIDPSTGLVYAGDSTNGWWLIGYVDGYEGSRLNVNLRENTIGIANYAFNKHESLYSVIMPDTVKEIGYAAFYKCANLETVVLPTGIEEIPDFCFYECALLDNICDTSSQSQPGLLNIPNTVKRIGRSAFYKCSSEGMVAGISNGFRAVNIPTSVEEIGNNAFLADSGIFELTFELENSNLKTIGDRAFNGCNNLVSFTLPQSVETIGAYCFEKCYDLVTADLGGVKEIGASAFSQCYALTTMHIPDSTVTIKDHAFYWCNVLEDLTFGDGLETIEHHAFYANLALTSLALPASIKTIEPQAFRHCQGLESVVLSKDIETIGNHAFYDCRALTIYTDASQAGEGWAKLWNSTFRPIIWNCRLSSNGRYVVSFVKTSENSSYIIHDRLEYSTRLGDPYREGYLFDGWTTVSGNDPEYDSNCVMNGATPPKAVDPDTGKTLDEDAFIKGAPIGSTLYAVWVAV